MTAFLLCFFSFHLTTKAGTQKKDFLWCGARPELQWPIYIKKFTVFDRVNNNLQNCVSFSVTYGITGLLKDRVVPKSDLLVRNMQTIEDRPTELPRNRALVSLLVRSNCDPI